MDLEDDGEGAVSQQMFAVVHSMVLSGQNLVQSQEYKDLTNRGFFITAISWCAESEKAPQDIIQFYAGFEDRKMCVCFKYSVQGAFRFHNGNHRKTLVHVDDTEKAKLFILIEDAARTVLTNLLAESSDDDSLKLEAAQ